LSTEFQALFGQNFVRLQRSLCEGSLLTKRDLDPDPVLSIWDRRWILFGPSKPISRDPADLRYLARTQAKKSRGTDRVLRIRILLIGIAGMLNEIVHAAISSEPDMTIVDSLSRGDDRLGALTRQRRIHVVIYPAADTDFDRNKILGLLQANPRLSLLAIDGRGDAATLHRLAPAHDAIGRLAQSTLTAAIRAGAALRKG
jgi:hypothetical protein